MLTLSAAALLPGNVQLLAGLSLGVLCVLVFQVWLDPEPRRKDHPVAIPDQIAAAGADLQAAYDTALTRAQEAHGREQEALTARKLAEDTKASGRAANDALENKRKVFQELLAGFYVPPGLPPAAS